MAKLPKPSIPGTVAVNLPAIIAGDTTIRNIRVEAEPVASGWNIQSAAATLPGRTRFEGAGLLETGASLSFEGNMLLAISQPSGFAAWLAKDVDDAIRRLPSAGFSADVNLTQDRQSFENLELILGDAQFRGSVDRQSPENARPSLTLNLKGDQLDVEGMQAFASLFIDDTGRNRLASHDVDLDISAGPVTARGLTADRLETALRLREGVLEIDRFAVSGLAQARISATGQIRDIGTSPTGRVDATVIAVDLAPLAGLLAQRFPKADMFAALSRNAERFPGLLADSEVNLIASIAENNDGSTGFAMSADGLAGGTEFSASLSGEGYPTDIAAARTTVNFTGSNDNAAALYALFGLPALPLDLAGGGEVNVSASGEPAHGMNTDISFLGEGVSAGFEGEVAFGSDGMNVSGGARLRSGDLEPWLALAGVSFPGFGFGLPAELSANVEYSNAVAAMTDITGQVAGSSVSGELNGELRDGRPHLSGELALGVFDIGIGAEMIAGSDAFQPGDGSWQQTPFRQSTHLPVSADLKLSADELWFRNTLGIEEAQLQLTLEPGMLSISQLTGQAFGGTIEGLAEFRNNDGTGLLSAQLSTQDSSVAALMPETGLSGSADLSASLTASGKSVDAMAGSLSGSGSVGLRNFSISGLEDAVFAPILEEAKPLGVNIDAEAVAQFAPPLLRGGAFPVNGVEFAFSAANGVLRTPPVQLENDNATMSVEAEADLRDRLVSATGTIAYDAGEQAVAGSEPAVRFTTSGPLGEAQLELDTEPLAQFLTQRALEREQRRVEHMQAVLLEKQRLRREARYFEARANKRRVVEAERRRLERQAEMLEEQKKERERQKAEQTTSPPARNAIPREEQGGALPDPQRGEPPPAEDTIERKPLPPARDGAAASNISAQSRSGFAVEDLSVDKLLELLDDKQ